MIKVLLVEDEELLRREISLTTPWEEFGCRLVGEAENGLRGRELILRLRPQLVITDIRMPGMDGLAMLESLKQEPGFTGFPWVILLTGHDDFVYARKGLQLGVRDYLLKPVDDGEFHGVLERIAGEIRQMEQNPPSPGGPVTEDPRLFSFREYRREAAADGKENYVSRAVEYIRDHHREDISVSLVAEALGITDSYLSRLFRQKTSYTFLEYLTLCRLQTAVSLMKRPDLRINEIADRSGFRDAGYFSRIFRKTTGLSPARYKAELLNRTEPS